MKKTLILLMVLFASIVIVASDINIGSYKFKPAFKYTTNYNFLSDYDELAASTREIVSSCEKSGDKRACVQGKINELNSRNQKLTWSLDACQAQIPEPAENNLDWFYDGLGTILSSCLTTESTTPCVCGEIKMPPLAGSKIQFNYRDGYTLMSVHNKDGDELQNNRRSIPLPHLSLYSQSGTEIFDSDFSINQKTCNEKNICDDESYIRVVSNGDEASFLKKGSAKPAYCRGFSPKNHFTFCAKTRQIFPHYSPESKLLQNQPIRYKFALTVGSERRELKAEYRNLPVVIELEKQIAKYENSFSNADDFEIWREYVLGSAFQEGGFDHYSSDGTSVKIGFDGHGIGAMQIDDRWHPGCFSSDGVCCGPEITSTPSCSEKYGSGSVCQSFLKCTNPTFNDAKGTTCDGQHSGDEICCGPSASTLPTSQTCSDKYGSGFTCSTTKLCTSNNQKSVIGTSCASKVLGDEFDGICQAVDECSGKTAYDFYCNIASGVYLHFDNYFDALKGVNSEGIIYSGQCRMEFTPFQFAMKVYNGGGGPGGCDYPSIVESKFSEIFEEGSTTVQPSIPQPVSPPISVGTCDNSQGLLTYVDKNIALSSSFSPASIASVDGFNVGSVISAPLQSLKQAAANEGINIYLVSGYRDYSTQASLFESYVQAELNNNPALTRAQAEAIANTYSAYAGHSEHQLGITVDFNSVETSFEGTAEEQWLAQHAEEYGFVRSYPKNDAAKNGGYIKEVWHYRYVGTTLAQELKSLGYLNQDNDWTLNKYLKDKCGLA
ncbi:MAG: M15 family metallopeptidase [Nanoarchaeota archaeon]